MTPKDYSFKNYPKVKYWDHREAFDYIGQQRHKFWPKDRINGWADLERFSFRVAWISETKLLVSLDIVEKVTTEFGSAATWRMTGQNSSRKLSYSFRPVKTNDRRLTMLGDVISLVIAGCTHGMIRGLAQELDSDWKPLDSNEAEFTPTCTEDDESWLVESIWTGVYRRPEISGTDSFSRLFWRSDDVESVINAVVPFRDLMTLDGMIDEVLICSPGVEIGPATSHLVEWFPDRCRLPAVQSDRKWLMVFGEHRTKHTIENKISARRRELRSQGVLPKQ